MNNSTSQALHEIFSRPENAHPESPINTQGAEYISDSSRDIIFLSESDTVEQGKANLCWVVLEGDGSETIHTDTVLIERALDYIEQDVLYTHLFSRLIITFSSKEEQA